MCWCRPRHVTWHCTQLLPFSTKPLLLLLLALPCVCR
jgi:hypothetical protein